MTLGAEIPAAELAAFNRAMAAYSVGLGKAAGSAPRRAAFFLCDSLRHATRKAPEHPRPSELSVSPSSTAPAVVTYQNGHRLSRPLKRWTVNRTVRGKIYDRFAYASYGKGGSVRGNAGAAKTEIRKNTTLRKAGLARLSWGWVKHNIWAGKAPDAPWKRGKKERDPKAACADSRYRVTSNGAEALVANRLDYIVAALSGGAGAVAECMAKTTRRLAHLAEAAADSAAMRELRRVANVD